ncbi:MAG: MmcQ/YjbR family DNA-binding protein [Mucilaginibacter sp.]
MEINAFIYLEFIRKVMAGLPGATEGMCFGTPAFYVNKKLLARMWENGEVLVVRNEERGKWIQAEPEIFFVTDHYRNYPSMLINLSKVLPEDLEKLLTNAWMGRASKNQVKEYEGRVH